MASFGPHRCRGCCAGEHSHRSCRNRGGPGPPPDTDAHGTLIERPSDDTIRLLRTIARGYAADYEWPVWQYVVLMLAREDLDAERLLRELPTYQHYYRSVWTDGTMGPPAADTKVGLSIYGMHHAADPITDKVIASFLAVLAEASEAELKVTPNPRRVEKLEEDGSRLLDVAQLRGAPSIRSGQLFSVLQHEPATWSDLTEQGDDRNWDITQSQIRKYRGIKTAEEYLEQLDDLVGFPKAEAPIPELGPLALPEALDHLDLAWRLITRNPLVKVPRATIAARLTQPVLGYEDFATQCSALAEILTDLSTRTAALGSIGAKKAELDQLLPLGAERAKDAADTLRAIVAVRVDLQHSGARHKSHAAWVALGISQYGNDWAGVWRTIRWRAVEAMTVIREEISILFP